MAASTKACQFQVPEALAYEAGSAVRHRERNQSRHGNCAISFSIAIALVVVLSFVMLDTDFGFDNVGADTSRRLFSMSSLPRMRVGNLQNHQAHRVPFAGMTPPKTNSQGARFPAKSYHQFAVASNAGEEIDIEPSQIELKQIKEVLQSRAMGEDNPNVYFQLDDLAEHIKDSQAQWSEPDMERTSEGVQNEANSNIHATAAVAGLAALTALASLTLTARKSRAAQPQMQLAASGVEEAGATDEDKAYRTIDEQFAGIAVPSFFQLVSEPLAGVVDTANVGHLSRAALGGMGVAVAAQYSITKTFNDPLQRVTTSLVASTSKDERREAISAVLILAVTLGLVQVACFGIPTEAVIRGMGVATESAMFGPAVAYLRVRALGAPLGSLSLALTGVCRGLGAARPPLYASLLATGVNVALDPLLIFGLGWGCGGAAVATVAAQLFGLLVLARHLRFASRNGDIPGNGMEAGLRWSVFVRVLKSFGSTATVMIARNWGKVFCFTFMAREAAKLGPMAAAAHALTFQIGFATSQVAESLATSCQVMLAQVLRKNVGDDDRPFFPLSVPQAGMRIVQRGLQAGFALSIALGATTFFAQGGLLSAMTSDNQVRALASATMPIVLICQMVKAMAYPVNGALMGALDWVYSAGALWAAGAGGVGIFALLRRITGTVSLFKIWIGLTTFFGIQLVLGVSRVVSGRGPWRPLKTA